MHAHPAISLELKEENPVFDSVVKWFCEEYSSPIMLSNKTNLEELRSEMESSDDTQAHDGYGSHPRSR